MARVRLNGVPTPSPLARLAWVGYCSLIGTLLLRAPWSSAWELHPLLLVFPGLRPLALDPFLRSAVSGCGLLLLLSAILEIHRTWRDGRS
jgi:hypothetical protein